MAIAVQSLELSEEATLSSYRLQVADFKGDASYPTGGSTPVARILGFSRVLAIVLLSHVGYVWDYDPSTDKLKMYQQSAATGALTEVPNATNLSALTFRALVIGT